MTSCNYVAFETDFMDPLSPYWKEIFDLDMVCTDESILINVTEE